VRLVESARADGDDAALTCYVCDASLAEKGDRSKEEEDQPAGKKKARGLLPSTLIELRSDGTGFSAGGASRVERDSTNFQC